MGIITAYHGNFHNSNHVLPGSFPVAKYLIIMIMLLNQYYVSIFSSFFSLFFVCVAKLLFDLDISVAALRLSLKHIGSVQFYIDQS